MPIEFEEVHFRNGYKKDSPYMRVEFKDVLFATPEYYTPKHGEVLWPSTLCIRLGKVLEVKH